MSVFTGPVFILDQVLYTPLSAYSSVASAVGFTVTNVADRVHPIRSFRSVLDPNSNDIYFVYDLGATPPKVNSVFIDNTNVAQWKIQDCATVDGAYSDWLALTTSQIDNLTGRVKAFLDTSSLPQNERYIKIMAPVQAPTTTPAATAMVGGITIGTDDNVVELPGGGTTNIDFTVNLPTIVTEFSGGAMEPTEIGSKFVEITLPNDQYLRDSQEEKITTIINMGTAPFVFFENAGDISRAYLVRHSQYKNKYSYTVSKVVNVPLTFTEVL